jgi:hypothetical protein
LAAREVGHPDPDRLPDPVGVDHRDRDPRDVVSDRVTEPNFEADFRRHDSLNEPCRRVYSSALRRQGAHDFPMLRATIGSETEPKSPRKL